MSGPRAPAFLALAYLRIHSWDDAKKFGIEYVEVPFDVPSLRFTPEAALFHFRDSRNIKVFLRSTGSPVEKWTAGSAIRLTYGQTRRYLERYLWVEEFLSTYDKKRLVRLGPEALTAPWRLSKEQAEILLLSDEDFLRLYIPDSKGPELVTFADITSGNPELLLLAPLERVRREKNFPEPTPARELAEWGLRYYLRDI